MPSASKPVCAAAVVPVADEAPVGTLLLALEPNVGAVADEALDLDCVGEVLYPAALSLWGGVCVGVAAEAWASRGRKT